MHSNRYILTFVTLLCCICAAVLSILATTLKKPQELARQEYLNQQLLISAQLLKPDQKISQTDLFQLYQENVSARLIDAQGKLYTFEEAGIDLPTYLAKHQKTGYAHLPNKLIYVLSEQRGYVIPVNGYGLWDAIYGFLALEADGKTVIGTTWYEQKETPGLGAEIATPKWQAQFPGKVISAAGIRVVKPGQPLSRDSVDGIPGATKTSEGVFEAYKKSLAPYRPFLNQLSDQKDIPS